MAAAMLWSKVQIRNSATGGHVGAEPLSARAQEIARSHEEMLGLLRNLPETDYELSFTDLVERAPAIVADGEGVPAAEKASAGEASAGHCAEKVKERRVRRTSSERRTTAGGGGGGRDGVLLNMYVPTSLTRSLTDSRSRRGPSKRVQADCNKRDRQRLVFGCWSAIWEKGGTVKARRQ